MKHEERMKLFLKAGLYFVASPPIPHERAIIDIIASALSGGVKLIQLRAKDSAIVDFLKLAVKVRELTKKAGALLIINDRLDVALASDADGVHLGQDDFPVADARRVAPDLIIGASTHCVEEAVEAQNAGASYINIGPIFFTKTKKWQGDFLGMAEIGKIAKSVNLPFTVMGGIKKKHIRSLIQAGARTIALVTEVTMADNPQDAVRDLISEINSACEDVSSIG